MSLADIYNMRPYTWMDAINQGLGTARNITDTRLHVKYAPKEEDARYQNMLAGLARSQAQAAAAPRYYGGQADLVNNEAAKTATENALLPKDYQLRASSVGSENALRNAQIGLLNAKLTGLANPQYKPVSNYGKMAADLENIGRRYGENSPEYKSASQYLSNLTEEQLARQHYLNSQATYLSSPAMQERGLTATGKSYVEPKIISQINGSVPSADINNTYAQVRQKQSTDPFIRNKSFYGENYKKTMSQIDPLAFTYSGVKGTAQLAADALKAQSGEITPAYQAYKNMVDVQIPIATDQMRQYFGTSVQPSVKKDLEYVNNPINWETNPKVAMNKFQALQSVMDSEIQTAADRLQAPINPNSLTNPSASSSSKAKDIKNYSTEQLQVWLNKEK